MKDTRSGVQKLIRDECSDVFDVGCICHLADLAIKAGMQTLPVDIDHLFVDVFYYFFHSSKRKEEFCVLFLHQNHRQYLSTTTRWLSLLRCVCHCLIQFNGLKSFFLSCSEAETSKVVSILQRLENSLSKPLLLFLSYILPPMDKFNHPFQKSTNTTCQLYTEMSRLVRLYASNLLKPECIVAVGDDLSQLNLVTRNQLADENLGLGDATWMYISGMEEERDPKTLYKAVRSFYVDSYRKC